MFKFIVIMQQSAHMDTVVRLLWTYKIILERKNHWNTMVQFYYIEDDFLVLRESRGFIKLVCTAFDTVHRRTKGFLKLGQMAGKTLFTAWHIINYDVTKVVY